MTQGQAQVLSAIQALIERNGIPPTTREICEASGYSSTSTVNLHLKALRRQGFISFIDGQPRTIRLTACALPGAVA